MHVRIAGGDDEGVFCGPGECHRRRGAVGHGQGKGLLAGSRAAIVGREGNNSNGGSRRCRGGHDSLNIHWTGGAGLKGNCRRPGGRRAQLCHCAVIGRIDPHRESTAAEDRAGGRIETGKLNLRGLVFLNGDPEFRERPLVASAVDRNAPEGDRPVSWQGEGNFQHILGACGHRDIVGTETQAHSRLG